tara:strand:- start:809 stop:1216 length:408 start_codon:yes stop_codon:yes gene_type:complete
LIRNIKLKTQLLCTFAHKSDINIVSEYIQQTFQVPEQRIFVFENTYDPNKLYCTYNIEPTRTKAINTISIHRKKETNTLYTVNALNALIETVNNGVLDKSYQIDWSRYQNSFILTDQQDGYRVIELVFFKKITWN